MFIARSKYEAAASPTQAPGTHDVVRAVRDVYGIVHHDVLHGSIFCKDGNPSCADDGWLKDFAFDASNTKGARSSRPCNEISELSHASSFGPPVDDIDVLGFRGIEFASEKDVFDALEIKNDGVAHSERRRVGDVNAGHQRGVA